jgi:hypothetical protein
MKYLTERFPGLVPTTYMFLQGRTSSRTTDISMKNINNKKIQNNVVQRIIFIHFTFS